jgi:hypothetical protein
MYDDPAHEILVNGLAAARAKEYDLARHYLEWYLRLEPPFDQRMDALLALVEISSDPAEQRALLDEALVINPSEPRARRRLAILQGKLDPAQIVDADRLVAPQASPGPSQVVEAGSLGALAAGADSAARRFTCPNCGGRMVYTPDGEGLVCEYCAAHPPVPSVPLESGASVPSVPSVPLVPLVPLESGAPAGGAPTGHVPRSSEGQVPRSSEGQVPRASEGQVPRASEGDFTVAMATAVGHLAPVQQRVLTCKGCGAVFILPPQQITLTCPYCESDYVLEEMHALVAPSSVIPFKVDAAAAMQALRAWLDGLRLKTPVRVAKGRGLYLPAWAFTIDGQVDWHCQIKTGRDEWTGQEIWEQRDDLELVDAQNLLVAASQRLPEACRPGLMGYNTQELAPYSEEYLANWPAETYQETVSNASLEARQRVLKTAQEKVHDRLLLNQVRNLTFSSLGIIIETYSLVLLPAWLANYSVGERRYDVMVNGQTAAVTGARPSSGLAAFLEKL